MGGAFREHGYSTADDNKFCYAESAQSDDRAAFMFRSHDANILAIFLYRDHGTPGRFSECM